MPDPSNTCGLHCGSQQCQILNPLIEARDQICVLMDTSWVRYHWATMETPVSDIFGTSLASALAEPQNPIMTRMFGIMLFSLTYHPLPYCCFLGKTHRRKLLGQVICPLCLGLFQVHHSPLCFPRSGWFPLIFARSKSLQDCSHSDQASPPGYGSCLSFPFAYESLSPLGKSIKTSLCPSPFF